MTTPLTPQLQKLVDALNTDQAQHFLAFWEAVHQAKYTGSFTVHTYNGEPKQINVGQPIVFSIVQGDGARGAK